MIYSNDYYNNIKIQSYNSVFNFINSNRNFGKTWSFKKRAFIRGLKHGKRTIWIRRFQNEVKEAKNTFYSSVDLQKFCEIEPYDKDKKTGNFKQEGNRFYCMHNGKWWNFLTICKLSDSKAIRSADDVNTDTIIFDEYTTTAENYKRFRGDEVEYFIDLFFSIKREHKVICFFLGNKESIFNPYLTYFGITPPPANWEGIRHYKNNSIAYEQINNLPKVKNSYDSMIFNLFKGTKYGNYIYNSEYKQFKNVPIKKPPVDAILYCQLIWDNNKLKILRKSNSFYVISSIDYSKPIYSNCISNSDSKIMFLLKSYKKYFKSLYEAISLNNVYYNSQAVYENIQSFYKWLSM